MRRSHKQRRELTTKTIVLLQSRNRMINIKMPMGVEQLRHAYH